MKLRRLFGALAATTVLAAGLMTAHALADSNQIHGCVRTTDGRLRVVPTCTAGTETDLSWNQQGPAGPPGPVGLRGYTGYTGQTGPAGPTGPTGPSDSYYGWANSTEPYGAGTPIAKGIWQPIVPLLWIPAGTYAITAKIDVRTSKFSFARCQISAGNDTDSTYLIDHDDAWKDQATTLVLELTMSYPSSTGILVRCIEDPLGEGRWTKVRVQAIKVGAAHITQLA